MGMAICMVELTSIARGIETSDDMIKAAQVTLLRGAEWAATGEVTLPVPDDFPTETTISLRKNYK